MAEDPFTACAEQLAHTPVLVQRLLAAHSPDEDGWCRADHRHDRHPCSIRTLAEVADRRTGRVQPGPLPPPNRP